MVDAEGGGPVAECVAVDAEAVDTGWSGGKPRKVGRKHAFRRVDLREIP